jgi:MYXO-CTERM domain-containing protein
MKVRSVRKVRNVGSVAGFPAGSVTARAAGAGLASLMAFVVVGGLAGEARAQSLRPNIMFIVDNSGSMQENSAGTWVGENTNICPVGGTASKLYGLKAAMRSALEQVGSDEANFGLMSFSIQVSSPPAYSTSTWCRSNASQSGRVGHYIPTAVTGRKEGCDMSTQGAQQTYGTWFDTGIGEILRVGLTTSGTAKPTGPANYDPTDANIPAIYKWIDNVELPMDTGAVTDPELHGMNNTPLGRNLFYSRLYFDNFVKPMDPKGSCRQNVVILVTDGAETCDSGAGPDNTFNLNDCSGGGSYTAFNPVVQACLLKKDGIKTYVITDTATGAANDSIANAGGTLAAVRVSLADSNAAKAAIVGIIASTVPPAEVCNGKDDNCNGIIDEGVANMCPYSTTDPNEADNKLGTAAKHCAVEIANCKDDNCNGQIDEGFPLNVCGQPAGCPISAEICDGVDNNCNGDVDEGFDVGGSCDNGLTGNCRRLGIKECSPDHLGVTCNLGDAPVKPEICNGIDDDCNGLIDDGMLPGVGLDCGIQGQGCSKGMTVCKGTLGIVCNAVSNPQTEICNGLDDDCNGLIDDGVFPGVGDACLCPGLTDAQVGVGMCRAGRKVCKGVDGIQCDGCVLPQPEICDGKDNDCDGVGDNMAMCSSGFGCREGACALLCGTGEFPCPPGYDCMGGFCIPNRCKNVVCGADQKCDLDSGSCVDLCFKVTCLSGQTCLGGRCLDCSNSTQFACQPGQTCVGRQCVTDKCYGVVCKPGLEYCANGSCVPLTCSPACGATERCVAGTCQPSMCEGISCASGSYCAPATGKCTPSLCASKTCPYCTLATGECTTNPCGNVQCPYCFSCAVDPDGVASCQPKTGGTCETLKLETGNAGGGCACSVEGAGSGSSLFASAGALLGLGLIAARRGARRATRDARRAER